MARFTETEIARLKSEVSVERLIEAAGIVLQKSGKDKVGLCLFHDDHEPSMRVTPATNLWHCPSCGAGGDVIAWVMKWRGIIFRHAVEMLRDDSSLAAYAVGNVHGVRSFIATFGNVHGVRSFIATFEDETHDVEAWGQMFAVTVI